MLKRQLPPLDPLVAFEAAARHLSFTKAARELSLSQAAISQQIRALEINLGTQLFVRAHRSVQLSEQGRAFQHTVSASLKHLAGATSDLRETTARAQLVVAADHAIASLWLMPRLNRFTVSFPDVQVRLVVSDNNAQCLDGGVDAAILHGEGVWPGFAAQPAILETVFPVCSPHYLARTGSPNQPEDLTGHALIELEDERWDWMNWRMWLSASGVHLTSGERTLKVNTYPLVIEAAKAGHGFALGWRGLVDDALASGALVRPLDRSVYTRFAYYLLRPEQLTASSHADAFCHWVMSEFPVQDASPRATSQMTSPAVSTSARVV